MFVDETLSNDIIVNQHMNVSKNKEKHMNICRILLSVDNQRSTHRLSETTNIEIQLFISSDLRKKVLPCQHVFILIVTNLSHIAS
jgi:hypothetical protein